MRLPKSKKAGDSRAKASLAFFIIAQLILAVFASSTALASSIKYDDSYTYDGGSSSDGVAWGGGSLSTKLDSYTSGTQVACFDWCGDGKLDHCFGKSGDLDKCKKLSGVLKSVCDAGKCVSLSWWQGIGDWHPINTGNAGDKWTCAIWSRYYWSCGSTYKWEDTPFSYPYYVTYPRQYDCDGDKTKTYDDRAYFGSTIGVNLHSDVSCSGNRVCNQAIDDKVADYGLYGTSKPSEPCSVPDGSQDCSSNSDCFSGSICDCDDWWDCNYDLFAGDKDYCCPSGQKWDGSKCAAPCKDNDGDGHKDSSCGGDDCNDKDSGVWKKNSCDVCAKEPSGIGNSCTVGVGACQRTGKYKCDSAGTGVTCDVSPGSPSTEVCNGIDDDCDGETDEGVKNACGSCGAVPSETCGDGVDNDCDGSTDEGCCSDPNPYDCAKTGTCWTKEKCDEAIYCKDDQKGHNWYACVDSGRYDPKCVDNHIGCCEPQYPYYCPGNNFCFSADGYCDGRTVHNCNGKYQVCNKKTDVGTCFGDVLRCCPPGESWWESDGQCHKSSEPQKCSVPDGSSANCDCDSDSNCPSSSGKPYCGEGGSLYDVRTPQGYHACLTAKPEYCGNGKCSGNENYNNCTADCGQLAPKGTINVGVFYSQGVVKDKPVRGAYVYLESTPVGTTDSTGWKNFEAKYGWREVKVECPNKDFCQSSTVHVDGIEYSTFRCPCNTLGDSDGDGYSDDDERLLGTDPNNAKESIATVFASYEYKKGCLDKGSSISLEATSLEVVQAFNVTSVLSQSFEESPELLIQVLSSAGLKGRVVENQTTLREAAQTSEEIVMLPTASGVLVIATDDDTGITSIFELDASCSGTLAGIGYGAQQSAGAVVKGFLDLPGSLLGGIMYLIALPVRTIFDFDKVSTEVSDFFNSIPKLWSDETQHTVWVDILSKGAEKNPYTNDKKAYIEFQLGFFNGYIGTYAIVQLAGFGIPVGGALKLLESGAKLEQVTSGLSKVAMVTARISKAFKSQEIGSILAKMKIAEKVADWSQESQDTLAGLIKLAKDKKVKDVEKWLDDAGEIGAKRATDKVSILRKTAGITDDHVAELMKTKLGRQTLASADATTDLLAKQSKLVQKWGVKEIDEVVSKGWKFWEADKVKEFNKLIGTMSDDVLKELKTQNAQAIIRYNKLDELVEALSELKGVKGFDEVAETLAKQETWTGPAYQLRQALQLKQAGKTVVELERKIPGTQVDIVYREANSATEIFMETKNSISASINSINKLKSQLSKYYAETKTWDKIRLASGDKISSKVIKELEKEFGEAAVKKLLGG